MGDAIAIAVAGIFILIFVLLIVDIKTTDMSNIQYKRILIKSRQKSRQNKNKKV